MRDETVAIRYEILLATAALAAHSSAEENQFRQRDMRFFIELFSNWLEGALSEPISIQNTQILRYLSVLSKEGYVRAIDKKRPPLYRLTRVGLIELLTRITNTERLEKREYFFFLLYFIRNYRERILDLVKSESSQFPSSLAIELNSLLDTEVLLENEIKRTKREILKLESRITDASKIATLVKERIKQNISFGEIVSEIEKKLPYDLNSTKPLSDLISGIPVNQRRWELENGTVVRAKELWEPMRAQLNSYLSTLKGFTA